MPNITKKQKTGQLGKHTVVYTEISDMLAAVRGMQGRTTKAIARELGLSVSQVQYRIMKAQRSLNTRFRSDYRNGEGPVAVQMLKATERLGMVVVRREIAPKFARNAAPGVPKKPA